jgi:CheY-like chemotaxis protein
MAHQFSYEHIAHLRDIAAAVDDQAVGHEIALGRVLNDGGLSQTLASDLRRAARAHCVSTGRLVSELGHRQDRPGGERSLPHAVLVVDDYADSRESLAMVLHNAGFIVRTASNGLEAVIAAYEMRPAVIVMDVMMPVLDGIEATRLIKAIDELHDACVIAYTAKHSLDPKTSEELFAAVLKKPASPDVVVAAVQRSLHA